MLEMNFCVCVCFVFVFVFMGQFIVNDVARSMARSMGCSTVGQCPGERKEGGFTIRNHCSW